MNKQEKIFIVHLDANQLNKRKSFIKKLEIEFSFPSYFGENLDAVRDCMTDLSWLPYQNFHLVISGAKKADKKPDFDYKTFLNDIKNHWKQYDDNISFRIEYT